MIRKLIYSLLKEKDEIQFEVRKSMFFELLKTIFISNIDKEDLVAIYFFLDYMEVVENEYFTKEVEYYCKCIRARLLKEIENNYELITCVGDKNILYKEFNSQKKGYIRRRFQNKTLNDGELIGVISQSIDNNHVKTENFYSNGEITVNDNFDIYKNKKVFSEFMENVIFNQASFKEGGD